MGNANDIFVTKWGFNADRRLAWDGSWVSGYEIPFSNTQHTLVGNGTLTEPSGYWWGLCIGKGMVITQGVAGGSQIMRYTKKLATDVQPSFNSWSSAWSLMRNKPGPGGYPMALVHGPYGMGYLQKPDLWEMGSWDDTRLKNFAMSYNFTEAEAINWRDNLVRHFTANIDYSLTPPVEEEDMALIAQLQAQLAAAQALTVQLQTEIDGLEATIVSKDATIATRDATIATKDETIATKTQQIADLQALLASEGQETQELQVILKAKDDQITELQGTIALKQSELTAAQAKVDDYKGQLRAAEQAFNTLEAVKEPV
jgi:hypothetical protein